MRTLVTCLLVIVLATLGTFIGMGQASADDGGINAYFNSHRNLAEQPSLPVKAELAQVAQNHANSLASADNGSSQLARSSVPSGTIRFAGRADNASVAFNSFLASENGASIRDAGLTHIGSGSAVGATTGKTYYVVALARYEPPALIPAPAPVPVQPAPVAPAPVAPVVPEPVIPEPVVEAPAPAPVEPVVTTAPEPTTKPADTPTASPTPTPTETPTETPEPVQPIVETVTVFKPAISMETKEAVQTIASMGGSATIGLGLFSFVMARKNRKLE